jgi:hypothetical protein
MHVTHLTLVVMPKCDCSSCSGGHAAVHASRALHSLGAWELLQAEGQEAELKLSVDGRSG